MYRKLLKNDFKHNLLRYLSIACFITLSASLLASAGHLGVQLVRSIDHLFEEAKTPHILQMHRGEIDLPRMGAFVASHPEIADFQILPFLNIDNSLLQVNGSSLQDSVYDNGFSVQSERFDYLFDLEGRLIQAKPGEVYAPVFYLSSGLIQEGDKLQVGAKSLSVSGFVRDSQMNSSLSVSKRFVISREDFLELEPLGELESLIEFRLHDTERTSYIESEYAKHKLESNGPPILSYRLFQIVNAFSDGVTILALVLIAILVIGISMLCLRFALLAKLEEDYKELAMLKAIGLPLKKLKHLFLTKYLFPAFASSALGFLLSFALRIPLSRNMKAFFGEPEGEAMQVAVSLFLSALVFLILSAHMRTLATRIKRPFFGNQDKLAAPRFLALLPRPLHLALADLFSRRKTYSTLALIFVAAVFILSLPMTIYTTLSDESFVNYMGIGNYDVRIDAASLHGREEESEALLEELSNDEAVARFERFEGRLLDYKNEDGEFEKLWVDFGEHRNFPIQYVDGREPRNEGELALSKLKADEMKKSGGDALTLVVDGKERAVRITGIYSDLTNGGKSAKAIFPIEAPASRLLIPVELKPGASAVSFVEHYRSRYPFAKCSDTESYLAQIFGNTIRLIRSITWIAISASLLLIFCIVSLFVRMIFKKDLGENALLKALGFTNRQIRNQYFIKISVLLAVGLGLGILLSLSFGETLASWLLSLIGVHGIRFLIDPVFTYFMIPVLLLTSAGIGVRFGCAGLEQNEIAQALKEDIE